LQSISGVSAINPLVAILRNYSFILHETRDDVFIKLYYCIIGGARWPRGQCARRAIAKAKQRYRWSVIGWVIKIYYLEFLRALEGTLSRWSRLLLQSLAYTSFKEG
jgi:hypothetical protein